MARKKGNAKSAPEWPEPQSRNEAVLQNILVAENTLSSPESRVEAMLQAILHNDPDEYTAAPQSRIEALLLAILNGEGTDLTAEGSRNAAILISKIKGESYDEETQSRIEALLKQWCNA